MDHRRLLAALAPAVVTGEPTYIALADLLRGLVLDGRLVAGDTVPAERVLARDLGVSRTTVSSALSVLRAEGYLASRRGSGTTVARPPDVVERPDGDEASPGSVVLDLTIAAPSAPPQLGPLAFEAAGRLPAQLAGPGLYPLGLPDLRVAVARHLSRRGLPTCTDQVLITQGALHGWDLLLRSYVRPGDRVAVEQPGYPAAADSARAHSRRVVPIGVDDGHWTVPGPARSAALALVTPDHHNPTGSHADESVRRTLLRRLREVRVVADELLVDLTLDPGGEQPHLAALGRSVITVGSLSKLVWAGLRVGWVRAEPDVVHRLASARTSQDLAAPVLDQLLAVAVFAELATIRAERVALLRARRDHLVRALAPTGWQVRPPRGGLVLWADLGPISSSRLAAAARQEGVRVAPGPRYSLGATHDRFLRLPYTHPEPVLDAAVAALRRAATRLTGTEHLLPDRPGVRWTA